MSKHCSAFYVDNDYPVDVKSDVPPELRSNNPYNVIQAHIPNGGLYRGPHINQWFISQPAPPTTTYFNQVLLRNVHPAPPQGATEQYPSNQRLGNNYVSMPGINWYNSAYPRNAGPFNIKVVDTKYKQQ